MDDYSREAFSDEQFFVVQCRGLLMVAGLERLDLNLLYFLPKIVNTEI